jgi:ABC-2 type transport system ATP-binding protein
MTVFLTTQYLEEADALADRVGIIDHGHIVAEDTPENLKAEIGQPTVEVLPADASRAEDFARALEGFGRLVHGDDGSIAVQLPGGEAQLADVVRALDAAGLHVASLHLHQPSLDDVFLAKTGRKLEGSSEEAEAPAEALTSGRERRGRRGG